MVALMIGVRCAPAEEAEVELLRDLLVYAYGPNAARALRWLEGGRLLVCRSPSTGRVRGYRYGEGWLARVRAQDLKLIPSVTLASLLHRVLPYPDYRVVVVDEIVEDVLAGRTVFARHVIHVDHKVRPGDEVLVVSEHDSLLAVGRCLLSPEVMLTALRGPAVMIRERVGGCEQKEVQA